VRKRVADYEGSYRIKRSPVRMAPHNLKTSRKLEAELSRHGPVSFDRLTALCKEHRHGTESANHPYQFVTYCIRRNWLERVRD
jgi:hypothetical protein